VNNEANLISLPDDNQALKAMLCTLIDERDQEKQRANDLQVENLRLQLELERYRKWYYGPRADRLQSSGDLAQMLLMFAEEMDQKPVNPDDLPSRTGSRVERDGTGLPLLRHRAQGNRLGRKLAGGIFSRPLRTHPSCAQEVCLPRLREQRQ
jgi:hypothetical protein